MRIDFLLDKPFGIKNECYCVRRRLPFKVERKENKREKMFVHSVLRLGK